MSNKLICIPLGEPPRTYYGTNVRLVMGIDGQAVELPQLGTCDRLDSIAINGVDYERFDEDY